jgi:hypothetical protein
LRAQTDRICCLFFRVVMSEGERLLIVEGTSSSPPTIMNPDRLRCKRSATNTIGFNRYLPEATLIKFQCPCTLLSFVPSASPRTRVENSMLLPPLLLLSLTYTKLSRYSPVVQSHSFLLTPTS